MILTRRDMILGGFALSLLPARADAATQAIARPAFGSTWRMVLPADADALRARRVVERVIAQVDAAMSPWRADSDVARFNVSTSTDWQQMSAQTLAVITEAQDIARLTAGAFDPTVGPLVARYGFGPIQSETVIGYEALELDATALRKSTADLTLDLCGIAKGDALDRAVAALRDAGFTDAVLELGGEVLAIGSHPAGRTWQVAIQHPGGDPVSAHRIVTPGPLALATSGHFPQGYTGLRGTNSHLIDPITQRPATGPLASVSVLATSGRRADALATALTVLGPEKGPALAQSLGISALFLIGNTVGFDEIMTATFADHFIA